jgi:ABC-2 type transport system ATP-binding protein
MKFELQQALAAIPPELAGYNLALADDGRALIYTYEAQGEQRGVTRLVEALLRQGIRLRDIHTTQSSLEDIFVDLVRKDA